MTRLCTAAAVCLLLLAPYPAWAQAPANAVNSSAVEIVLALPFEGAGDGARLAWLGEGLAELTARRLAGANRVVLPRAEWMAAAERLGLGPSPRISRASLIKLAEQADADFAVFGSFRVADGKLTLTAHGIRLAGPEISPPVEESGPLERFAQMHAGLCWQLLRFFDPTLAVSREEFMSKVAPLRLDAFENYARGLLTTGPERIRLLREATRLEPEWNAPAFALGHAYLDAGNYDAAIIWLSRVPPASSYGLEATYYAAVCHLQRNDAPRAEAALRAILERPWYPGDSSPSAARRMDFPEVLNNLAIAVSRQGKWSEAKALWMQARELAPVEPSFAFNFALGALRVRELDTAERALRDALGLRADDQARAVLAALLDQSGKKDEAQAERAACEEPNCGEREEVQALFARGASPAAVARLDRISTSLDLLTWLLTGQSRSPTGGSGSAIREPVLQNDLVAQGKERP